MPDELETLLDLYGRKAGVYVLHNGIKIRVWYEGEEMKTKELYEFVDHDAEGYALVASNEDLQA